MSKLLIKKISSYESDKYINDICIVHKMAYSNVHLTKHLPKKILHIYYKNLVKNSDVTLISINKKKVNGFVIAGSNLNKVTKKFIKYNKLIIIGILLVKPYILLRKIFSFFININQYIFLNTHKVTNYKMRLFSIAVVNSFQSKGIGGNLIQALEEEFKNMGIENYGLSVKTNDVKAILFYKKNTFVKEFQDSENTYMYKNLR